ncbi:hypothetical protein OUZ56_002910 [Daphnia magna]|uniref:Uncharacterized protein n=1 Tax=Daphnia magna TaxID=35525 RepID=A0ABR0A758_9CRUS|nr:hypothetical protein OUZ56_002910 [Daphnia magna]
MLVLGILFLFSITLGTFINLHRYTTKASLLQRWEGSPLFCTDLCWNMRSFKLTLFTIRSQTKMAKRWRKCANVNCYEQSQLEVTKSAETFVENHLATDWKKLRSQQT